MSCNEEEKQLEEIILYYKNRKDASSQENLVSLLREIQELLDCIPEDVQEAVSQALDIKPAVITRLIKLYPSLTSSPSRHKITICLGPMCSTKEAYTLLTAVKKAIRNKPFHLVTQNCLKQCPTAPNMRIDGDLYPHVQLQDIDDIIKNYTLNAPR